jgi:hypothetical protein
MFHAAAASAFAPRSPAADAVWDLTFETLMVVHCFSCFVVW